MTARSGLPIALATLAALLWGLWWIPIRGLDALGMHGIWAGVALNGAAFLAALVWLLGGTQDRSVGRGPLFGAVLVGFAVASYSTAINYTDVVRAILLFYLAPAWSKLIETLVLGQPWTRITSLSLLLSFMGAVLILGTDPSAIGFQIGDVIAVISGMAWAAGATFVFSGARAATAPLVAVAAGAAVLTMVPFLFLLPLPDVSGRVGAIAGLSFGAGVFYVVPILALTLWSARRLAPSTLTFLLTAEILSGVLSGVVLLKEPFGPLQACGAALIIVGAVMEVVLQPARPAPAKEG